MGKIGNAYKKFSSGLENVLFFMACLIMGGSTVLIFVEVITRYFFQSSRAFMEEYPRLFLPYIIFPLLGVLLKHERHISTDLLPQMLQGRAKSIVKILIYLFVLGGSIMLLGAGVEAVKHFRMMGELSITEFVIPMWVIYLAFPLGFAILILYALELLVKECISIASTAKQASKGREEAR